MGEVTSGGMTQIASESVCARLWRKASAKDCDNTLVSPLGRCTGDQYACYVRLVLFLLHALSAEHCCNIKCNLKVLGNSL